MGTNKNSKMIPVHGNPGDKEIKKTWVKVSFCSRISFTRATWMQDVMQLKILSCGIELSSPSSDSAQASIYA